MRSPLTALWLLCACVPAGREAVTLPVVLSATDPGPFVFGDVTVTLDRATLTTADLLLVDHQDRPIAAWAGRRAANLLGLPGPHGTMILYEGVGLRATFTLDGDPTLAIAGSLDDGRSFSAEVTGVRDVSNVVAFIPIDADAPPPEIHWTVDLSRALSRVDWSRETLDDDAAFDDAVLDGFADPGAWRLDAAR